MSMAGWSIIAVGSPMSVADSGQRLGNTDQSRTAKTKEVRKEVLPDRSQDRLRMELHTFDVEFAVSQSHDDAISSLGGNFECRWQTCAFDDQRVIPRRGE